VGGAFVDGATGGTHDSALYEYDGLAETVANLEAIGSAEVRKYADEGYIAVEAAYAADAIASAVQALEEEILHPAPGSETLVQYERWAAGKIDELDDEDRLRAARKLTKFAHARPALTAITHDPKMLAIVSRLLGGAKPKLLQEMALLKPPGGREKPWHQDRAYFNIHAEDAIVGVWLALDEATPENGCMRLWPGRHKQGPIAHFQKRDWQICDGDVGTRGRVAVPLKPGGLLLFHSLLPHGTPRNATDGRRWAIQLHFHPEDAVFTEDEERLEVFGAEGQGVEC
jgi:ectoine hydroxylase-related dioxygenase (phytanoyl-CoA dioxygenase family)